MPPSPGHFWDSSVTAAPCGQKKQARAISHNHKVTGPEAETAGIRFRLATATTKSKTRSRRPSTRSRPVFFPTVSGRISILCYDRARVALAKARGEAPVQTLKARERTAVSEEPTVWATSVTGADRSF